MQSNQHRLRTALVAVATVVVLAACGSDGLVPDGTVGNNDGGQPPATDTRTTDAPTASNLMTTEP